MNHALMALPTACAPTAAGAVSPELSDRIRAGDVAALGEAYDAYHAHVRAFARRLVGDDASAEDVVQETFVALPSALRNFRGDAPLAVFVTGVAVNHARHHVRAAARRRAAMDRMGDEPLGGSPSSPESATDAARLARALVRALDTLSLEHRAAFVLCEVEERTSAEAAVVLGVPEGTVRTRLHHAKARLRDWFTKRGLR
jgi:RNA polymerase sigma-70 factor (ECF subfamily)